METTRQELQHIPELDGIRGIAVLWVVLFHFYGPFLAEHTPFNPVSAVLGHGLSGVDIFFVLSGYLITSILISTRGAENYFSAFYARRALRIFPLYFVVLAAYFAVILPFSHRQGLATGFHQSEQGWYWVFLANWRQVLGHNDGAGITHFWTLSVEEQFYVLFSVIVLFARRRLPQICVALIVLSVGLRLGLAGAGLLTPMSTRLTILRLDPLAMGALLACSSRVRRFASDWWLVLIGVGGAGLFLQLPAGLEILAATIGAAGAVGRACSRPVPVLRTAALRSLGKYSYAMYIVHNLVAGIPAHFAKHEGRTGTAFMLASVIGGPLVSYGLAWLSWRLLEERFLRLKARFRYRFATPASELAPV